LRVETCGDSLLNALEAIRRRCSIRRYKPKLPPKRLIEKVIDAGRLAPTAWAKQPWEFVVVTDPEMRRKIAGLTDYGKFIKDAPACIAVLCEETKFYLEDGCAATENMLIAATALGLGTCWVAGDKKDYARKVCDLLAVPASYRLVALIPLGYPERVPKPKRKRALTNVMHWERYRSISKRPE